MTALGELTLVEAAAAVRSGQVRSVELLEDCLAAVDAHNARLNAVIWIDRDGARASAEAADAAVAAGRPLGLLHGVPLAHKDMYYEAGRLSTCGSAIRRDWRPTATATVLERLAAAGSYRFAGLHMAEFAHNPSGHNAHYGDCRNPWNADYISGGSSSGSGVAVAARITTAALGSDTGGSVRIPAAACGVTGLKPTQTRISRAGVMPLSFSTDNVGPLARTARDCARILRVIAGHDPRDPTSTREPVPDYEAMLTGDLRGLRVGVPADGWFAPDSAVTTAVEQALDVLAGRGARLVRLTLPYLPDCAAYAAIVIRAEAAAIHTRWMQERPEDYAAHLNAKIYAGFAIPAPYYIEALRARGPLLRAFAAEVFSQVDVIAAPTLQNSLPTRVETDVDEGPETAAMASEALSANTRVFNYLGLPAVSLPCGFDAAGLPVSLQIAGRPFGEGRILAAADAYQRDTDWHTRRPPL